MAKRIAIAAVLAASACGRGSNEVRFEEGRPAAARCLDCGCANTPTECGTDVCVDCTLISPDNAQAVCVFGSCDFVCAEGFHGCRGSCLSDTDVRSCGTSCAPCPSTANGAPFCLGGQCGIRCAPGFVEIHGVCQARSFSISY